MVNVTIHPWCMSPSRDEAVRAAEDNRTGPLPTLEHAISAVTDRRPPEPGGGENVTGGLRTERVTLEVTHDLDAPLGDWIVQVLDESLGFDESVRVVEEDRPGVIDQDGDRVQMSWRELAEALRFERGQARAERDAAIRERDTLRAERITQALTADRFAAAVAEADALKARVEELEAAAKLAPPANADGGSNHATPQAASGSAVLAEIAAAFGCEPDDDADLVEAAKLLVRERDTAVAKAASGAAGTEPDAWGVRRDGSVESVAHRRFRNSAEHSAEHLGGTVVPLYAAPQAAKGWLTKKDREWLTYLLENVPISFAADEWIHSLLARSSPPEVVLPPFKDEVTGGPWAVAGYNSAIQVCREALADAGVTVKEVGRE